LRHSTTAHPHPPSPPSSTSAFTATLAAAIATTIATAVSAPPSSPTVSPSPPHRRHPHRPPRSRHLPRRPCGYVARCQPLPPSPSPPSSAFPPPPRSPPSALRRPHYCHRLLRPQSLTTAALTTTLAAIAIPTRPEMRNGRDARACPRHMRARARPPALRTHSTHPACAPRHFLALTLHNTHPLLPRFLADLNASFPTMCGRSCGT